jgi:hypothetical protein
MNVISLRDTDSFFRSGSIEQINLISRIVVIFRSDPTDHAIFNTDWATIMRDTSSLMTTHVDEHQRMFIDRPPRSFPVILNYLETGKLDVSGFSNEQKRMLLEDAEFFHMRELKKMIAEDPQFDSVRSQ